MAKEVLEFYELPARTDIPAAFTREIGRIMVQWAYFEHCVQRIIWILLDLNDSQGRVAVREPRIADRLEMLSDLAELRAVRLDKAPLRRVKAQAEKAQSYRDLLAHGVWVLYPDDIWRIQNVRGQHGAETAGPPHRSRRMAPGATVINLEVLRELETAINILIEGTLPLERMIVERLGSSPKISP